MPGLLLTINIADSSLSEPPRSLTLDNLSMLWITTFKTSLKRTLPSMPTLKILLKNTVWTFTLLDVVLDIK